MKYVLAILLLTASAYAAEPAITDPQPLILDDFSGGLNTTFPAHKIPPSFSPNLRNVYIDNGTIKKRGGFTVVGTTPTLGPINFLMPFPKSNGDTEFLVSDSSVVLSTKDFLNWTLVRSNLNPSVNLFGTIARDKAWMTNGIDFPFTWTGSSMLVLNGALAGLATVPKFKYIVFDQERIWGFNLSNDNSGLVFSAVSSTDGIKIAPDDSRAWPSTNQLECGQGDGEAGSGIFVKYGQLFAVKEKSIYTRYGTSESDYQMRKTAAKVGFVSQDSIVQQDNLVYGQSKDGDYVFDGANSERITDAIVPDVEMRRQDTSRVTENTWDSQADFSRGAFNGTTATASGLLQIITDQQVINRASATVPNIFSNYQQLSSTGDKFSQFAAYVPSFTVNPTYIGILPQIQLWTRVQGGGCSFILGDLSIKNSRTGSISHRVVSTAHTGSADVFEKTLWDFGTAVPPPSTDFTGSDINGGKMLISISTSANLAATCFFEFYTATQVAYADINLMPSTTGQYLSEASTIPVAITAWGNFDSDNITNGGSINYFIRGDTSTINLATTTWVPITAGSVVSYSTTQRFVQWSATVTATSTNTLSAIDNVIIRHVEGLGSFTRSFGASWKNRYWLAVTTESTGNYPIVYVKSKITNRNPNAWMRFYGLNIRSLGIFNDNFYAGSSTSGVVFRMDYGTNDNGQAIDAIYETPDLSLSGNPFYQKSSSEYLVDLDKESGATLRIGYAKDGGSFTEDTISTTGTSGRYVKNRPRSLNPFKVVRYRIRNNQLDIGLNFHTLGILWKPTGTVRD